MDPKRAIPADDQDLDAHRKALAGVVEDADDNNEKDEDDEKDDETADGETDADAAETEEGDGKSDEEDGDEEPEFTAEELAAALADDDDSRIPAGRFKEVNSLYKLTRAELAEAKARLALLEQRQLKADETPPAKARDFDAEMKELRKRWQDPEDTMTQDEYDELRDKLVSERTEAAVLARLEPEVNKLKETAAQARRQTEQQRLSAAAEKVYEVFPFLNINDKANLNEDALDAVMTERDDLIERGVDPVRALNLAVSTIAPQFGKPVLKKAKTDETDDAAAAKPNADEIAAKRKALARKAAMAATEAQPPSLSKAGTGTKETGDVISLTRSVEDFARWEKLSPADQKKVQWR
jgi:hypothetical protein